MQNVVTSGAQALDSLGAEFAVSVEEAAATERGAAPEPSAQMKGKTGPRPTTAAQMKCPHDPARAARGGNQYACWTMCLACGAQTEYWSKRNGLKKPVPSAREAATSATSAPCSSSQVILEETEADAAEPKRSQGPASAIPEGATKDDLKEVVQDLQSQNRELATMIQKISEMQLQSQEALSQQTSELTKAVAQMAESIENTKGDRADEFLRIEEQSG